MSAPNGGVRNRENEDLQEKNFLPFPKIHEGKIPTEEFLTASRGVVHMVDKFGKLFAPVKYDMQGNIDKLTTKYTLDRESHDTLQDMILLEKAAGETIIATDALLWLRRGLHMILLFFEKIIEDHKADKATEDLVAFLKKSYKEALEPYHGWMAQQLFGLLSRLVPTRSQLLLALANGHGNKDDEILSEIEIFLVGLKENVMVLHSFYEQHNLNSIAIV
ncbi:glycolipid transfer protein [Orussus abietinus]|uniref:glycolipid transfer protein n=1 Tax=Orussus abietinus TaxID=222816 RepID=UPI0006263C75|nr:glycolipid transfer protein [Orussus abietinus]